MSEYPWNQKSQPEPKEEKEAPKDEPFSLAPKEPDDGDGEHVPPVEAKESLEADASPDLDEAAQAQPGPDESRRETVPAGEGADPTGEQPGFPDAEEAQSDMPDGEPQKGKNPEEATAKTQSEAAGPEHETAETPSQSETQQAGACRGEQEASQPPMWGQEPGAGWETPPGQPPYGYPPYGGYPPPPYPGNQGQPPYQDPYYGAYPPPQQPWYDPAGYSDYTPYNGQPPQPMNKGMKAFIGIMIGLASIFVLGFLIWGIVFSINRQHAPEIPRPSSSSSSSQGREDSNSSSENQGQTPMDNTVGNQTNPDFPGIALLPPAQQEMEPKDIYRKVEPAIVGVVAEISQSGQEKISMASGMIVTSDGYILTNAHVIGYSRDSKVHVVLSNKTEHEAVVVGYDRTSDLAVLKIEAQGLTAVEFGSSDALSVGDWVFAIGNPRSLDFSGTLTRGIVSALNRQIQYQSAHGMTYIQTDAAINPGNSGGALVNMYGQVVGINSAKISLENYEGMGFSIEINKAKSIIESLIRYGYVKGRVRMGITGMTITAQQAQGQGVPQGVLIVNLASDSPLKKAGARVEDIITGLDGETVSSMDDLDDLLLEYQPGDEVTLTLYREGQGDLEVTISLLADQGELQN
ncbi:MAG: trypsin-like serine protease [Clostridiales bacterium]|jgi:serine protease Do|nr:trypsin-like serine protease [Clostridiales bacterium]